MLHMVVLNHTSDNCPGVSIPIRDRVLTMFNTLEEVPVSYTHLRAHET